MVFHWSLSDCKSPQVSRTLRILADLNNVVARMVSTGPLISQFSILGTNPLVTVPSAPITIGITVTFMFHAFFSSLTSSWYLSLFSLSFSFTFWSSGKAKSAIRQVYFSCFCWLSLGLVVWPRFGGPFVSQNLRKMCASHFLGRILGCTYTTYLYSQI